MLEAESKILLPIEFVLLLLLPFQEAGLPPQKFSIFEGWKPFTSFPFSRLLEAPSNKPSICFIHKN